MIYCILGQTASGKTSLAISLARRFSLPIISADAYQCYKMMQVGTDKPKREEVEGIDYFYYDEYEVDHETSVYEFQNECRPILEKCQKENKDILVVGGNFLYVKALLFNYVFLDEDKKENKYQNMTLKEMQDILKEKDLETYLAIDNKNERRVIRSLTLLDQGKTRTEILNENDGKTIYPVKFYQIEIDKEEGNNKIDKRIDKMVEEGLLTEIEELYKKYPTNSRAFSTIGYKEVISAIKNNEKIDSKVIDLIKVHTHQYAKKQRTFLRHQFSDITKGDKETIRRLISEELERKN